MDWWSLFRTITVVQVLSSTTTTTTTSSCSSASKESENQESSELTSKYNTSRIFLGVVGLNNSCTVHNNETNRRPVCKAVTGCDVPLNCYNHSVMTMLNGNMAIKVTPRHLEHILDNSSVSNVCALVMFYAPWCPYSVEFARQFNAIGRTFRELPVLAIDYSENDPYKYLTAYIPVVNFYYRGRVLYRFKATESYEELVQQISIMTKFPPVRVDLNDSENEHPVPTVRTDGERVYLLAATCWVLFVLLVTVCRSTAVSNLLHRVTVRLRRTKNE